jgi:hypothetical protein
VVYYLVIDFFEYLKFFVLHLDVVNVLYLDFVNLEVVAELLVVLLVVVNLVVSVKKVPVVEVLLFQV